MVNYLSSKSISFRQSLPFAEPLRSGFSVHFFSSGGPSPEDSFLYEVAAFDPYIGFFPLSFKGDRLFMPYCFG
jgi:hypothetical protein